MNDERVEEWGILMGQFTDFIFYLFYARMVGGESMLKIELSRTNERTTSFNAKRVNVIGKDSRFGRLTRWLLLKFLCSFSFEMVRPRCG